MMRKLFNCFNSEHNKSFKIFACISYSTIMLAFIVLGTYFYWSFYPYNPLVVEEPIEIVTHEVNAGEYVTYRITYCKNMDLPVTISRRFVDGLVFTIPQFTTYLNDTGCRTQDIFIEIPEKLPAGEYNLNTDFIYQVNPIRKIKVNAESEKFTVIKY